MFRLPLLTSLVALLVGACGPGQEVIDDPDGIVQDPDAGGMISGVQLCPKSPAELSWPQLPQAPSPCAPLFDTFALPQIAAAAGAIELEPSARLQPLGLPEQVSISVLLAQGGDVDNKAKGALTAEADAGVQILSIAPLEDGRASLRLQVQTPGPHWLKVSLEGDQRTGSVGLWGFKTQLPIVEIFLARPDLKEILKKFKDKIWVPALARIQGEERSCKLRLHGGSSKEHPKKSLRLKLDSHVEIGRASCRERV